MIDVDLEQFEQDRAIDPAALDVAALTQADVFFQWAMRATQAKTELEEAKLKSQLVESRLNLEARASPEKFLIEGRVTEAVIQSVVTLHPSFLKAQRRWIRAREKSVLLDRIVEAMEQRKRMIEVLVTLHGQQYFAGPSVPRNLAQAYQDYRDKIAKEVTSKQTRRTRSDKPPKKEAR